MSNAQVFLVGGAVRDLLLGKTPKDFDFVVVGSSPEEMVALGFSQVGNDFPIFLHPTTGDEFALARTERKVGNGHTGFECNWEGVTLEEDLSRRDLTINAMAFMCGNLSIATESWCTWHDDIPKLEIKHTDVIDLFNGQQDLDCKVLRHVSEHFAEDPLRVLRLARFLARFGEGWTVNVETLALCKSLVEDGSLDSLTPERVWKELSRALMEGTPSKCFELLHTLAWDGIRELSALEVVEQRPDFHPEGDAFVHTLLCLDAASKLDCNLPEMFAVLCHDLGKRPAFDANRGHLGGHEKAGIPLINDLCDRWKVDNKSRKLALTVAEDHTLVHNLHKLTAKTVAKMFDRWGLLRDNVVAKSVMLCCTADGRGRGVDHENDNHPNAALLIMLAIEWINKVDVFEQVNSTRRKPLEGKALGDAIRRVRVSRLEAVIKDFRENG